MDELTRIENESIAGWLHSVADEGYFEARVLDFGCGAGPYRQLVEEHGGEWFGYDRAEFACNRAGDVGEDEWITRTNWDVILCTQVIQFVTDPYMLLYWAYEAMRNGEGRYLVLTHPTNWPEVNEEDLWRFTKRGMARMLSQAGFLILRHERRETIHSTGYEWALGYGVLCRAS